MSLPADRLAVSAVSGPDEVETFLRFPWTIYRDDPLWVPPLLSMQREFIDPDRGPFFEFGQACFFLAF